MCVFVEALETYSCHSVCKGVCVGHAGVCGMSSRCKGCAGTGQPLTGVVDQRGSRPYRASRFYIQLPSNCTYIICHLCGTPHLSGRSWLAVPVAIVFVNLYVLVSERYGCATKHYGVVIVCCRANPCTSTHIYACQARGNSLLSTDVAHDLRSGTSTKPIIG